MFPYQRGEEYFADQIGLPLSAGTVKNFNQQYSDSLESFEESVKKAIINSGNYSDTKKSPKKSQKKT